jgi:hypothetical protein
VVERTGSIAHETEDPLGEEEAAAGSFVCCPARIFPLPNNTSSALILCWIYISIYVCNVVSERMDDGGIGIYVYVLFFYDGWLVLPVPATDHDQKL